jgi:hypothetical protein
MKEELFKEITTWQNNTFVHATATSKLAHLQQEMQELLAEIKHENYSTRSTERKLEFADCFILLFGAAASDGMNYEDIQACLQQKMAINYQRNWGKPNEDGVVNHV